MVFPLFVKFSIQYKPDDECEGFAVGEEKAAAGDEDDVGETDSAVEVVVGGSSFGILSMAEEWQSRSPPLEDGEAEAEEAAAAMAAAISDWESIPAAGGTQEAVAVFMAEGKKYWKSEGRKCLKYVSSHRHS